MLRVVRNFKPLILNSQKIKLIRDINPSIAYCHAVQPCRYLSSATAQSALTGSDSGLKLSESCVNRLKEICTDGSFLRITVEGGGCSGFQYKFDFDTNLSEEDLSFGTEGAKVVIDSTSLEYVAGATIDYHVELIKAGFRILHNPKAEGGCSCGASFSIKLD